GWHVLIGTAVGAAGILLAAFGDSPWLVMIGVSACATGGISSMPLVYSLPARILSAVSVGAGLALVNLIGNVGGFAGPLVTGWLVLIGTAVGAAGILLAAFGDSPWLVMIGVSACATGVISSMPLVYSLPARILSAVSVGAGLALVNSIGNVGGFAGPFVTGWLRDLSGSTEVPFVVLAGILLGAGVISVQVQRTTRSRNAKIEKALSSRQ